MYNFGPLAAENDPDILRYFHKTEQVANLVAPGEPPASFIFVARTGGGKTALVKWLEGGKQDRRMLFIRSTELRLVMDEDDANAEDYRILMSAELFAGIISELRGWSRLSEALRVECDRYFAQTWLKALQKFLKERFEGLSIMGYGFSLKASDRRAYLREIRKDRKVDKASQLIRQIADEVCVTIVVDNPEFIVGRGLEDVTPDNATRIGAFLSVLNHLHSLGIQVIVLAKEHILQSVQRYYRDFMHFQDRVEGLDWTENDLMNVLELRIDKRLQKKWEDVFTMGKDSFRRAVFPNLTNGPRDLICLCNQAGQGNERISMASLQKSIRALRRTKWIDIATQYGTLWPSIDTFAQRIITVIGDKFGQKTIRPKQFHDAIEEEFSTPGTPLHDLRTQERWINTAPWASPNIEERLFVIGCLGYVYEKRKFFPWQSRSLAEFRLADSIFVSPLFV